MSLDIGDLGTLHDSFLLHLRAERKSPQTVKTYGDGVRAFLAWCADEDVPPVLDRPTVDKWVAALLDAGLRLRPPGPASLRCAGSPRGWPTKAR